jgi:hypothetical protein
MLGLIFYLTSKAACPEMNHSGCSTERTIFSIGCRVQPVGALISSRGKSRKDFGTKSKASGDPLFAFAFPRELGDAVAGRR